MKALSVPAPNRGALLLVALASVLPRLGRLQASLWNDETFSTHLRLGFNLQGMAWLAYDNHPPLYNLIMLVWVSVFGDSALSIRALPLACSVASVYWMGRVAGYVVGERGAVLAAALLGLSGASVFYAQEARSYSFIILLFLLMAEAFLRYERRGDAAALRRLLVLSLLCAVSHVYALLFVLCFWALLLFTARTGAALAGIARATLALLAAAAPFYFLIVLMLGFTSEYEFLWRGMTDAFTPRDAATLLSFYLFGYGGANAFGWAHALATALFLAGVAAALWRREAPAIETHGPDYSTRGLGRFFAYATTFGLAVSLAALAAPWWLPVRDLQAAVGADKQPDLLAALPDLLPRTATLYLAGYALLVGAWAALGAPARPGPLVRFLYRRPDRPLRPLLKPADVPVAFPLLAIVLVVVISAFRPTFNSRYLLALMAFGLLAMAVAVWRVTPSWVRLASIGLVTAAQAASLSGQRDAYARLKPDYKGALQYASRLGRPVTGNAVWELDNLSRYYAGRREIPPLSVVSRPEAMKLDRSVVFVADAYPLDSPHLAELKELIRARAHRSVAFDGLTLYEIGPRDLGDRIARHP